MSSKKKVFGSKITPDFTKRVAIPYKERPVSQPIKIDEPVQIAQAAPPQVFQPSTAPVIHAAPVSWSSNEVTAPIAEPAPLNDGVLILENTGFSPDIATYPSIGESYFLTSAQATSGDVSKWAEYQAINDVDLNGNNINNVVYVNAEYVNVGNATLSEVNDNLLYNGVQVATLYDVATWSENPAVGDVNMLNNSIVGLSQINNKPYPPPPPAILAVSSITVNPTGYISTSVINGLSSINGSSYPPTFTVPADLTLSSITMNPTGYISTTGNLRVNTGSNVIINEGLFIDSTGEVLAFVPALLEGGNIGQITGLSTINGVPVGAGVASLNGLNGAVTLAQGSGITLNQDGGTKTITINATAPGVSNTITGQNTFMTATGGTLASANANITAGGGVGGNITAIANAGDLGVSGGNISLTANGGTGLGGLYGVVNLTANPGTDLVSGIATGGSINILANSPTLGATSKVAITGGGVNIYSGIFTPIASVFGYTFLNASLGTSIVTGGFSPFPQSPGTTYIYSAQGTIIDNGLYVTDIQPVWDGNPLVPPAPLTIHGRTAGGSNVPVILNNVETLSMQGSGAITGVVSINGSNYPPPAPSIPANLNLSTLTIGPAGTISFTDITGPLNCGYMLGLPAGDLTIDASPSNATFVKGGYTTDATPPGAIEFLTLNQVRINPLQNTPAITAQAGILIGQEGVTMTFPTAVGTTTGCGKIENLSTINGIDITTIGGGVTSLNTLSGALDLRSPSGTIDIGDDVDHINLDVASSISLTTLTMNTGGSIGFTSADGVMTGISTINAITFTDHDIGNVGQLQVQDGFTLDGAGTITLNGSSGSPGQVIGIPVDGSYPEWVDAGGGSGGVASLEGLTGDITFSSTGDTIAITTVGTTINLETIGGGSGGVATLNGESGTVILVEGEGITITPDTGTGNITIAATAVVSGVSALNGLTGSIDIVSPDGSIIVNAADAQVNLTQNRDVPVSVISPTSTPEVIIPVSGTFYAIVPTAAYDTVSFNMSGFSAGTTFTVKNVATTNHDLNIQYDDGTGSVDAVGVNLPLLHPTNTFNSVMALCYWNGTTLTVY